LLDKIDWYSMPHIQKRLLELDAKGTMTQPEMARQLQLEFPNDFKEALTRDQLKNAIVSARNRTEYLSQAPVAQIMPYFDRYQKYIKGVEKIDKTFALPKNKKSFLVVSDLHVPFQNEAKLQKAIDLNRTADTLIIAGDLMEMYNTSRWRKRKYVPSVVEYDNTVRVLEYLSKIFEDIYVFPGNHDIRAAKKLHDIVPPELFWLLEDADALEMLTRPFPNIHYVDNWFMQVGDALIAHAERSSTIEGKPPILTMEYFLVKGWAKRLKLDDIRCVIQAHTHQVSAVYREELKMLECGALCTELDYTTESSAVMRPPMMGCVRMTQYNGHTDFNETREILL